MNDQCDDNDPPSGFSDLMIEIQVMLDMGLKQDDIHKIKQILNEAQTKISDLDMEHEKEIDWWINRTKNEQRLN